MSLVVLLFYFVLIGYSSVNSSNTGGCKITDFSATDWDVNVLAISDTQTNQNIFESKYEGTLENIECTNNEFFNVAKNESYFFVATTDDFKNFDMHTEKTNSNSVSQTLACTMTCSNGESSVNIVIRVTDTNNHDPTFDSLDAEYKVAIPIMPMADFSLYGTPIVVTDIDFSNQNVTFTMDPDDFTCSTQSSSDSKQYRAVFRANKIIQIEDSKEYTLTATDSGTNPKTRSVSKKFTLVSDPASSFDRPTFQRASYSFTYAEKDGKCSLTPNDGDITLITNKPNDIHGFSITGDLKDNFEVKFDNSTKTISISCLSPVQSTSSISVLSISVETDSVSAIPVVLYLADIPAIGPKFSSIWYTAEYDRTSAKVSLNQEIGVTPSTATLELSDSSESSYKKYFELKKESDKYEVVVSEPLPDSILNNQNSIVLTITATLDAVTSKATLVINIPAVVQSSSIRFEKVLYSGSYEVVTGAVTFTTDSIKIIDTETGDRDIVVKISEDSSYSTYFTATCANKVVTIGKAKDLPQDILKSINFIPLTLEASVSGIEGSSSAVLNVIIKYDTPEDNSHINFGNILYDGTYANKNGSIKINSEITIDTDQADNVEVSITNEYKEYFTATYSDKKVTIALSNPVSPKSFDSRVVSLVLQAKIKSTAHSAQTVLNLQVEDNSTGDTSYITFGNILYDGTYANKNGSIKINSEITIDTDQADNVEVSITNENKEYFTATYSDKKVTIALSNPDSPKSFESRVVSLVLQAKIKSTAHTAQTVLNLEVEDNSTGDTSYITFGNILYDGTYANKNGSIKINSEITIDTDQADNVEVSITNEYKEYFTATYSDKKVTIALSNPDSPKSFESRVVSLVLQAKIKSTAHTAQTVLNLEVEDNSTGDTSYITFGNILYDGSYANKNGSIKINSEITVDTDQADNVEVSITNEYKEYFTAIYSDKKVTIALSNRDSPKSFESRVVSLVLQAKIKSTAHSAQTVLNLEVEDNSTGDTSYITFGNILYDGSYANKNGSIKINSEITVDTDQADNVEVSITNEYKEYFTAIYSDKKVTIALSNPDSPKSFESRVVSLVLQAKIKSTAHSAQTVLNLEVEDNSTGDTSYITFGNILYDGTYANKNGSIKINSEITIDTDQADNVEVSITNEYKEYFTATYSDEKVTIALSNPDSPKSFESRVVSLVLQAKIKSTSHTAQTVLNLEVEDNSTGDTSYITFGNILYDGTYANKNGSIKINSEITIDTDQADNVEVSITNENKEYFTATYSDKKVTIALSNPDSPKSFESRVVSLVLQAKIKSTAHTAQTVLNLQVEDGSSEDTSFISFSKTLYEGKYIATSNSITIDEEITVNTDKVDDIEVSIINEYKEYFTVQYAEKKLTVTLLKPISSETLKSVSLISILLQGSLKSTSLTSQAVVNLKVIVGELSLKSSLYNGKYEVEDNKASMTHDKITVETDQEDDEVDVKIINGYDSDFNVAYSKKEVQVTLLRETASKTLLSLPNIPILIQINIKDTPVEVNAVLNLRVYGDGKEDTKTLSFSRPLYSGNYSIHEAESVGHLEIEPLSLITNLMDSEIEVTLSNEYDYDKLFEVSQQSGNVVINIKGEVLPDIVLTQEKFLALTVNAKIIETGSISSAVLNIRIYYNDNENGVTSKTSVTGYIVAVAILAVLLVGLIVATVGFYVWKRKSESYEKMLDDTGSNKVKFEQRDSKHSINEIKRKASSALEERRPTGFVYRKFDENGDEIVKEPVTEQIERRKSVAFDDNIEKLQIDPIVDDDIDKALEETEPSNTATKEEGYKSEEI